MIVVDSNVVAYLLIDGPKTSAARSLLALDPDWHTEAFALVELTNIFATSIREDRLGLAASLRLLSEAESVLEGGIHAVVHSDALSLAHRFRITAYDARYLAIALGLDVPLVTEDRRLRKAAPDLTRSMAEAASDF